MTKQVKELEGDNKHYIQGFAESLQQAAQNVMIELDCCGPGLLFWLLLFQIMMGLKLGLGSVAKILAQAKAGGGNHKSGGRPQFQRWAWGGASGRPKNNQNCTGVVIEVFK